MIDSKLDTQTQSLKCDYKQLFSNKVLNAEFNNAMDAKWEPIFALFKHFDEAMFPPLFSVILNTFLEKVPVAELFD